MKSVSNNWFGIRFKEPTVKKKGHRDIDIVLMDEDFEELEVVYPGFAYDAEVCCVKTKILSIMKRSDMAQDV